VERNAVEQARIQTGTKYALIATVMLVGVLGVGAVIVNYLAPDEQVLASERLVPVMIHRPVFMAGLSLGVASTLLAVAVATLLGSRPAWQVAGATLSFGLAGVAVFVVLASIVPEWGSLGSQSMARVKSKETRIDKIFGLTILFNRGRSELTPQARDMLKDNLAVFESCATGEIGIRGFASRRPFRAPSPTIPPCDSNCRNNGLANARALAVHAYLKSLGVEAPEPTPWTDHDEMMSTARIMDIGPTGGLLPEKERLNQRVEVFWREVSCPIVGGSQTVKKAE
jgi:hypothetical protein